MLLFAASAASSVLRSKTLKLTGFTPGNLSQIGGPQRIRDSLGCGTKDKKAPPSPDNGTKAPASVVPPMFGGIFRPTLCAPVTGSGPWMSPSPRMAWYSCSVIAVFVTAYSTIVSQIGPNVNRLRPKTGKFRGSYFIKIRQSCSGRK